MATLEQFLQTGALGPIHPGMTPLEVIDVLGPPQDESVAKHPYILKYGGLQLTFLDRPGARDRRLAHIGLYFAPCEPVPAPTLPTDFKGTPETTLAEVRAFLARVGLKEQAAVEGEETNYLILPSGAQITFDGPNLYNIIFTSRAPAQARRQLSVSLSEDTWSRLRTVARQSKRSVAELCAEWITQRADELQPDSAGGVGQRG